MRSVTKADREYAAKFGVSLSIEKHGIYGDEWDWVAKPSKPSWYPNVGEARTPVGTEARSVVRIVAERMGTGKADFHGFKLLTKAVA